MKIPETQVGTYSYRNLELVYNTCMKYWNQWKKESNAMSETESREKGRKAIRYLRLSGVV